MDIEDSEVPYRAFLRSGSYPALTQRVMRSGGLLAQAAGWFALVLTAASAGYTLTQHFTTPPVAPVSASIVRPLVRPAFARSRSEPLPVHENDDIENGVLPDSVTSTARRGATSSADKTASARKRSGAVQAVQPTASDDTLAKAEPPQDEPARALATAASSPPDAQRASAAATSHLIEDVLRERSAVKPQNFAPPTERVARAAPPSRPLMAAARIERLSVRGPLSAAQLRRSVDRVRSTLSECYAEAARRAGHNRFAQVRVGVTIDEAGRVKTAPKVEGAQLPGFGACLSSAISKLVCQAPDTGTAKVAIVLGFHPER